MPLYHICWYWLKKFLLIGGNKVKELHKYVSFEKISDMDEAVNHALKVCELKERRELYY